MTEFQKHNEIDGVAIYFYEAANSLSIAELNKKYKTKIVVTDSPIIVIDKKVVSRMYNTIESGTDVSFAFDKTVLSMIDEIIEKVKPDVLYLYSALLFTSTKDFDTGETENGVILRYYAE